MIGSSIHQSSVPKFVNFERFEDYLKPRVELCTPSLEPNVTILSFTLDRKRYKLARKAWEGKENLVFIGHDPSCFAPEGERSSFK